MNVQLICNSSLVIINFKRGLGAHSNPFHGLFWANVALVLASFVWLYYIIRGRLLMIRAPTPTVHN
jgi:hypothetical protein